MIIELQVMDERQNQIQQRMETVRIAQQESLERREELLKDLEMANQLTRREVEDKNLAKIERKREIDSQVTFLFIWEIGICVLRKFGCCAIPLIPITYKVRVH